MGIFLESGSTVSCVSAHVYLEPHACDLCQTVHADEILVIKNRSGKKLSVATPCLKEMIRFQVVDADDLPRWLTKISELRSEAEKRKEEEKKTREEERERLGKSALLESERLTRGLLED